MPEGSGITGKQDSARESASPSRGPGEQPGFASPASETPSYPVPNSFATWSLSPSSPECVINEAEWRECNPLFNQEGFDLFSSFLRKLRELRLKSGGPEGLGHMLMWMSGMEALLDSLFIGADVELNQHGLDEAKLDNAIALVQRQVRGLRAEHTARRPRGTQTQLAAGSAVGHRAATDTAAERIRGRDSGRAGGGDWRREGPGPQCRIVRSGGCKPPGAPAGRAQSRRCPTRCACGRRGREAEPAAAASVHTPAAAATGDGGQQNTASWRKQRAGGGDGAR
ncbi:hypothetical protein CHLRE_01g009025v5 [Chlamydomonas reinhardtii]|uniref:Uncharacterized protein n=1 Tax=Chlamydomonas reinhardtii TaxID=3055 RepID=A0A2K3E5A6_CHLRE|nr:uncharacterized protein CHLRE_01g009025v5 [Chlamydomonas reinhardtii]PNW87970.1 hypothetical protein CHLRE_01g009025v5 [Chlamydomonas reinhardtii]